jgi:hypothetical protein
MEWYWWVLIVIGVVAIAFIKIKVLGMIMDAQKKRQSQIPEEE